MRIATHPTDHLIVKAEVVSDWDDCSFAILYTTPQWRDLLYRRSRLLKAHNGDKSFHGVTWWDFHVDFFRNSLQKGGDEFLDLRSFFQDRPWHFVETSEEEINGIVRPDNKIRGPQLRLLSDDSFRFVAWGSHTGERFDTWLLPTSEIAAPLKKRWFR